MTNSASELNIGVVGAGGFANFAAKCFVMVDGIKIVAVADVNLSAATAMAESFEARAYQEFEEFLADDAIDMVYIATPPSLHYQQSRLALLAGKHVICEKPAALLTSDAEHLVDLAKSRHLLYVVNLMQRYNPLYRIVKQIIDTRVLGEFTHGYFENYASDEFLHESHWFWDDAQSGGIFIEHGVHFFDLFSGWLGKGEVIYAAKWQRPEVETEVYDRVMAIVNYPKGPVSFYHGFDQPKILDRQEMKLQFERGDITLYGWIPVRLKLSGLLDSNGIADLKAMIPEAKVGISGTGKVEITSQSVNAPTRPGTRSVKGRFKHIGFDHHVSIAHGDDSQKMSVYADLLKKMITDQRAWILDNSIERVTNEKNAVDSLRIAQAATSAVNKF
jgi:predicted dehydrogenase